MLLIVPTITLYEVYKILLLENDREFALTVVDYMQTGTVIGLDAALSLSAVQAGRQYKLAMADSIICATALNYAATLWTCDKHFKDIPGIKYFPKNQ